MADESTPGLAPVRDRPASWKRRLRIVDLAILIALLSVDLALFRGSIRRATFVMPLLGLLAIMVGFVWRFVPRGWDRLGYVAALVLYLFFLGLCFAGLNPLVAGALRKSFGIQ
ncbi:MAG TPA: hypothetical protein VGH33_08415 [Isosphaeraceae bacterium]